MLNIFVASSETQNCAVPSIEKQIMAEANLFEKKTVTKWTKVANNSTKHVVSSSLSRSSALVSNRRYMTRKTPNMNSMLSLVRRRSPCLAWSTTGPWYLWLFPFSRFEINSKQKSGERRQHNLQFVLVVQTPAQTLNKYNETTKCRFVTWYWYYRSQLTNILW